MGISKMILCEGRNSNIFVTVLNLPQVILKKDVHFEKVNGTRSLYWLDASQMQLSVQKKSKNNFECLSFNSVSFSDIVSHTKLEATEIWFLCRMLRI